jgi:thioredoxin-dependent peroxiredoxin
MLRVGDLAPSFDAAGSSGERVSLASLRGRPVVVYFYPKANTAGCTAETRGFAALYPELRRAGIELIGVSVDSAATQAGFAERCGAEFPLVADADKSIARAYGVVGLLGVAKRVTFFLDATGRVTEIVEGLLPGPHVRRARELVPAPGDRSPGSDAPQTL